MSSFLQLLRIAFWLLPLQRWLAAAGIALIAVSCFVRLPLNLPGSTLPAMFLGASFVLITPILLGGLLWRSLSAPRALMLLPHGRLKLLLGAIGIALAGSLLWMLCYALAFLDAPPKFRPGVSGYLFMFNGSLTFASLVGVSGFIASRSPFAMLCVLAAWLLPAHLLKALGADPYSPPWEGVSSFVMLVLAWVAFGIWYLRARRISVPGWLLPGGSSVFATTMRATRRIGSRDEGLEMLLLGGGSARRAGLQWFASLGLLLGVQTLLASRDAPSRIVVAVLLGSLLINAVAMGSLAFTLSSRSRSLWLTAARARPELFLFCERLTLRVVAWVSVAVTLLFGVVWNAMAPLPQLPWYYVLPALLAPGLAAAYLGLAHLRHWRPQDVAAGVLLALGGYYGSLSPLLDGRTRAPWAILAAQLAAVVLLRVVAQRRWRRVDWPRTTPGATV